MKRYDEQTLARDGPAHRGKLWKQDSSPPTRRKPLPNPYFAVDRGRGLMNGGSKELNLARVSTNGQITVPVEIRRALKIKEGDKVLFYQKPNGEIVINNTSLIAIQEALSAGEATASSEEDVLAEIVRLQYGKNAGQKAEGGSTGM